MAELSRCSNTGREYLYVIYDSSPSRLRDVVEDAKVEKCNNLVSEVLKIIESLGECEKAVALKERLKTI